MVITQKPPKNRILFDVMDLRTSKTFSVDVAPPYSSEQREEWHWPVRYGRRHVGNGEHV